MKYFIGIDPGLQGCLCLMNSNGKVLFLPSKFCINVGKGSTKNGGKKQNNIHDLVRMKDILKKIIDKIDVKDIFVILEAQQSMPKQGVASTFKIGKGFGAWEMALICFDFRYEVKHPKTWQKLMFENVGGIDLKQKSLLIAKRLFPTIEFKKNHNKSDAVLIAEYARRKYNVSDRQEVCTEARIDNQEC